MSSGSIAVPPGAGRALPTAQSSAEAATVVTAKSAFVVFICQLLDDVSPRSGKVACKKRECDDAPGGRRKLATSGLFRRRAAGAWGGVAAVPSAEPVPEPRAEPPAHCQRLRNAPQVYVVAGMRPLLQPLDVLEVHDGGAVNAHELPDREALLPFTERLCRRLTRQVRCKAQRGAVTFRLDGHDVAHPDEGTLLAQAQEKAVLVRDGLAVGRGRLRGPEPAYRHGEPLWRNRLQQVVEGIHLECAKGVRVVGGHENDVHIRVQQRQQVHARLA